MQLRPAESSQQPEAGTRLQVPAGPQRDLRRGRDRQGRLYWRWRVSSRLSGSVWQVDCGRSGHLGSRVRLRDSRSLRQDLSLQELDQRQLRTVIVQTYCDILLYYSYLKYLQSIKRNNLKRTAYAIIKTKIPTFWKSREAKVARCHCRLVY